MSSITVKVKVASASENNTLEFAMNLEDTVAALKLRVFEATERRPEAQRCACSLFIVLAQSTSWT
jgi:hypothetical protein